jgi:hypothetical protein
MQLNSRNLDRRLRRLEQIMDSSEHAIRVQYYTISAAGELIPWPDPSRVQDDDRPAQKTYKVIFVDSDGNGRLGPCYRAYQKRQEIAGIEGSR